MADYKNTMNLPTTEFPMRASLSQREPRWLVKWHRLDVYGTALERRAGGPPFILHDGPPYANGHIHMGTAYNKVLKDLVVKYKTMRGFLAAGARLCVADGYAGATAALLAVCERLRRQDREP